MRVLTDNGYVKPIGEIITSECIYFRVTFARCLGSVSATLDHLWNVLVNGMEMVETTEYIYNNFSSLCCPNGMVMLDNHDGKSVYIKNIKKVYKTTQTTFKCYELSTDKHQFYIYPKRSWWKEILCNIVYRDDIKRLGLKRAGVWVHNCQCRIGCGRLQSMTSMMLFGSTVGTSINGAQQGAGMFSANGVIYNIQYFYEEVAWILRWYKKCGFNEKGYCVHGSYPQMEIESKDEDVEMTAEELDDVFNFNPEVTVFESDDDLKAEVNRTEKQSFE